ncbi:MAG TPA: cupin domain-containing protein [Steroidobacteraceae bacterium]|jgi:quercetin dioxygenase-like cupin family protein|nr:cupin domain-containing protein [Steroidobacteraceae bacterium]
MRTMLRTCWPLALLLLVAPLASGDEPATYTYATNGIKDHIAGGAGSEWKLLLNESNLGGKELEMVEVTLAPGTTVGSHTHGSLEVIYVLSGTYDHEVNGKLYELTPGMVGIVRPGDHVRHLVPKSGPAKLLILWAPGGEAARVLRQAKGVDVAPLPLKP